MDEIELRKKKKQKKITLTKNVIDSLKQLLDVLEDDEAEPVVTPYGQLVEPVHTPTDESVGLSPDDEIMDVFIRSQPHFNRWKR
jgi:hypothetical protein